MATFYRTNVSDTLFKEGFCLPSGFLVTKEDIVRIAAIILNK